MSEQVVEAFRLFCHNHDLTSHPYSNTPMERPSLNIMNNRMQPLSPIPEVFSPLHTEGKINNFRAIRQPLFRMQSMQGLQGLQSRASVGSVRNSANSELSSWNLPRFEKEELL